MKKLSAKISALSILFVAIAPLAFANLKKQNLPARPIEASHPASSSYNYQVKRSTVKINNRQVDIYLPESASGAQPEKFPVLAYGHGQAIGVEGYDLTFKHLARKGIAVIHPMYDSGFFDQDWRRMGRDFNDLVDKAIAQFANQMNRDAVIYSGHSKGGYVALIASGLSNSPVQVDSVILFAPAGYDAEVLKSMSPDVPLTLVWPEADSVIKKDAVREIYDRSPSRFKQFIQTKGYDTLKADHFYPLSKSFFFGGRDGESTLHYFASWNWLVGAVWDVTQYGSQRQSPYLYGAAAAETGIQGQQHQITRSW